MHSNQRTVTGFPDTKQMLLVLLMLIYSGNPALSLIFPLEPQLIAAALLLGILLMRKTMQLVSWHYLGISGIFAGVLLAQCIELSFYPLTTIAGFFIRLFIGYSVIRLASNFPLAYIRAMAGLALVSFVFYIPYIVLGVAGFSLEQPISSLAESLNTVGGGRRPLLFHTFLGSFSFRNSGIFWEPGAFQGYLILALVFLALAKQHMLRKEYVRSLVILYIAVLSTLSTTGYIALALVSLLHYNWRADKPFGLFSPMVVGICCVLPLVLGISWRAYTNLPFLGEKIASQMDAVETGTGRWHRGRIGSLVFDWEYIQRRPMTGWGLHSETRYSLHPGMDSSEGMGNGFSDFTAKMGIIGMATWFVAVYIGFYRLSGRQWHVSAFICGILLLELQGECFLGYPLFLGLAFIGCATALPIARKAEASTRLPGRHRHPTDRIASVHNDDDNGYQSNRCPDHMS